LNDILAAIVPVAIFLCFWLLPKYLAARVTQAAKGAVDERVGKALAEHQHELDKQLEIYRIAVLREGDAFRQALGLQAARYSQDYALFATKRNEVYAETYAAFERARGGFAPHFSAITMSPDFSHSAAADLDKFRASEHISEGERAELSDLLQRQQLDAARRLADTLYKKVSLRKAHIAFRDFKNVCVLNALYYSREVDRVLQEAISVLARMAAYSIDLDSLERAQYDEKQKLLTQLDAVSGTVRETMRAEMQAGFHTGNPEGSAVHPARPGAA